MAIRMINAIIQMRHGREEDFDPDQMTAGEWGVSDDTKKVWMCFMPGLVLRMATYEAFEEDMKEVQLILATCRNIQTAVEQFVQLAEQHSNTAEVYSKESQSWAVGGTGTRIGEDTNNSKYYSEQSANSALMSKSYSDGNTGIRVGESTDNSLYYSQKSKVEADTAKEYLGKVEKAGTDAVEAIQSALDIDAPDFQMDLSTGRLMYSGGRFVFDVQSGRLKWGLAV